MPDCLQAIISVIPLQLLSYHLAVLRGLDVCTPRRVIYRRTHALATPRSTFLATSPNL